MKNSGGNMTVNASFSGKAVHCKIATHNNKKKFREDSDEKEKWVYFAIARRRRKVGPDFLQKIFK